ncbi:prepilin-type N-terminal cleavage/methylation domain-containing protein [Sphingobium sp. AN641]|uniref:type II secretion system protein n=1 Tax=Sphingobium sp. AN641 TaxID=3133443 RepID=UPI0030C193B5
MEYKKSQFAFSLVELSIVLVILGLLTGGILAGQSLIRAAEVRAISADASRYEAALAAFRDRYFSWPGDIKNATAFWGTRIAGSDQTCYATINVYTGTCNGNGDGIYLNRSDFSDVTNGERFLSMQHLSYAGLIEGSFTGASASSTSYSISPGVNSPQSKIGTINLSYANVASNLAHYFPNTKTSNVLNFNNPGGAATKLLKPEEIWNLDTKLDDGKPASGKVFGLLSTSSWGAGCTTTDSMSTAEYAVATSSKTCDFNMTIGL